MKTASNWANRPHSPPGDSGAVPIGKGIAMNVSPPRPARKTVPPGMGGSDVGRIHTPGWFSTKK